MSYGNTCRASVQQERIDCSAIIVNYNGGQDLVDCIASVLKQQGSTTEIIVVDNASNDGSLEKVSASNPTFRIIRSPTNEGFAGGANLGARAARGAVLLFLNPDVVLDESCAAELCERLRARPGVAGPRLFIEASGDWEYGAVLDLMGFPQGLRMPARPMYVAGCALATDRETFDLVGGFDQRYFMIYEDADYCWRVLLAGRQVSVAAESTAVHKGGGSTPGGYIRDGRREVSSFRLPLLERNRLATLLKCAPLPWLAFAAPACVAWSLAMALWVLPARRWRLSRTLLYGLVWNMRELPATVHARRHGPLLVTRRAAIQGRIRRDAYAPRSLMRHGLPRFVQ